MKKGQEPAFPRSGMESKLGTYVPPVEGMSLRQYYAAKAMQAILRDHNGSDKQCAMLAFHAFNIADAMIAFEEEEGNND